MYKEEYKLRTLYIKNKVYNVNNLFIEFMENRNMNICTEEVKMLNDMLSLNKSITDVPHEYMSERICLVAIIQNENNIMHIPHDKLTEELCFVVITNRPSYLKYIPDKFKTERVCIAGVSRWGRFLSDVSYSLQTLKICETAMINNPNAFIYMDDKYKTNDLCWRASIWGLYLYVPENKRTEGMRIVACRWNPFVLKNMSENEQTFFVCFAAVEQNYKSIEHIKNDKIRLVLEICHANNFL